jgi:integrase
VSVTREDVAEYRAELTARDLAATRLNQTRAIVHGIFVLAVERFGLEDDPSVAFKRAKTRPATSDKIGFYPPEEVIQLVQHADSEQDAAVLPTAAFTGLRASELRALRWRSVDAAGSLIHVERDFTDEGGEDLPKSYRVAIRCRGGRRRSATRSVPPQAGPVRAAARLPRTRFLNMSASPCVVHQVVKRRLCRRRATRVAWPRIQRAVPPLGPRPRRAR